jgi:hypothetical protein
LPRNNSPGAEKIVLPARGIGQSIGLRRDVKTRESANVCIIRPRLVDKYFCSSGGGGLRGCYTSAQAERRMPWTVKQVEPTPNPNAVKFVLDRSIAEHRLSFQDPSAAADHPLATRLFDINGVSSLMLLGDFITVCKSPAARWSDITKNVKRVLAMAT